MPSSEASDMQLGTVKLRADDAIGFNMSLRDGDWGYDERK